LAQIDFYISDEDELELLTYALSAGLWLVADRNYETSEYPQVTHIHDYLSVRNDVRQFFIGRSSYVNMPMSMRRVENEGSTFYYIFPRDGGPTISFLRSGTFERNGRQWLRPGFISHYPWYFNPVTKENDKPPRELILTFRKLSNHIKSRSTRIKPGVRSYWISRDAQALVKEGCGLIGLEQFAVSFA
jgi:hypothetical protein